MKNTTQELFVTILKPKLRAETFTLYLKQLNINTIINKDYCQK